MRTVIQRVLKASVAIDGSLHSAIQGGLLLLVGFEEADTENDLQWMAKKIVNMRIFNDEGGVMNRSLLDVKGELLVVSQFTLHASTKKGNRPSYIRAAKPEIAVPLYEKFIALLEKDYDIRVQTGIFGADMQVSLINDGPVTIIMDSQNKNL